MTYERFQEYLEEAVKKHISRDPSLHQSDMDWENQNLAETLVKNLRLEGLAIERPAPRVKRLIGSQS